MLNAITAKLDAAIKMLPEIAANDRIRKQLVVLHQEAKGAAAVIKAEIVRLQTPDE